MGKSAAVEDWSSSCVMGHSQESAAFPLDSADWWQGGMEARSTNFSAEVQNPKTEDLHPR